MYYLNIFKELLLIQHFSTVPSKNAVLIKIKKKLETNFGIIFRTDIVHHVIRLWRGTNSKNITLCNLPISVRFMLVCADVTGVIQC